MMDCSVRWRARCNIIQKPIISSTFVQSLINSVEFHTILLTQKWIFRSMGKQSSRRCFISFEVSREEWKIARIERKKMHNVFIYIDRRRSVVSAQQQSIIQKKVFTYTGHFINNHTQHSRGSDRQYAFFSSFININDIFQAQVEHWHESLIT